MATKKTEQETIPYDKNNAYVETMQEMETEDTSAQLEGFTPDENPYTTQALEIHQDVQVPKVEGLHFGSDLTTDQKLDILENVESYIGTTPVKLEGSLLNNWIAVKGCLVMNIQKKNGESVVDNTSGEVVESFETISIPLFKLVEINRDKEHIILSGGGQAGLDFARLRSNLFGPGDWAQPMEIKFSSESRTGGDGNPRILYRVKSRKIQNNA